MLLGTCLKKPRSFKSKTKVYIIGILPYSVIEQNQILPLTIFRHIFAPSEANHGHIIPWRHSSARVDVETSLDICLAVSEHKYFFITNGQCLVQFSESYGVPNRVAHDKMVYISNRLCMNTFELYFILLDMYWGQKFKSIFFDPWYSFMLYWVIGCFNSLRFAPLIRS